MFKSIVVFAVLFVGAYAKPGYVAVAPATSHVSRVDIVHPQPVVKAGYGGYGGYARGYGYGHGYSSGYPIVAQGGYYAAPVVPVYSSGLGYGHRLGYVNGVGHGIRYGHGLGYGYGLGQGLGYVQGVGHGLGYGGYGYSHGGWNY